MDGLLDLRTQPLNDSLSKRLKIVIAKLFLDLILLSIFPGTYFCVNKYLNDPNIQERGFEMTTSLKVTIEKLFNVKR